jgi:predicted SAM-dependent methyltransferase
MFLAQLKSLMRTVLPTKIFTRLRYTRDAISGVIHGSVTELKCKSMNGARVNVGCGNNPTSGWVNLDVSHHPGVMYWDCTKGLPFKNGMVDAIYSEHFFEHLDYDSEAKLFLRECLRCLKPHGTLRIVVPDAGAYLKLYAKEDFWLGRIYKTRMEFINAVFRQYGQHKYAYDAETLIIMLQEVGFSSSSETTYNVSSDPNMTLDTPARRTESLYVEGRK